MQVRKANMTDLQSLVDFTSQEAREAEGKVKNLEVLEQGIEKALLDESLARYWVLVDQTSQRLGSVSALREWSDWHAGFYWWVQSLYIDPAYRGERTYVIADSRSCQGNGKRARAGIALVCARRQPAGDQSLPEVGFCKVPL